MSEAHPYERIDPRRGGKTFTHDELDGLVKSLASVGSPYDYIALCVERDNRPRCYDRDAPSAASVTARPAAR